MTTDTAERDGIFRELEDYHDDKRLWSILADWHEDHTHERVARAVRFLTSEGKRPMKTRNDIDGRWHWFAERNGVTLAIDAASDLPEDVFDLLVQGDGYGRGAIRSYDSLETAFADAVRAVIACRPEKGRTRR